MRHRTTSVLAGLLVLAAGCDRSKNSTGQPSQGLPPANVEPSPTGAQPPSPGGGSPHGDLGMPGDPAGPHGGMAPNPHGVATGDPDSTIAGSLDVAPALKDQVKPGDTVFLIAKAVAEGGAPIGVGKLEVKQLPQEFQLALSARPAGEVTVTAWLDRDGEALSHKPGDIKGEARTAVPATGMRLVLDTPVQ